MDRRDFIKVSTLSSGGILLTFSTLANTVLKNGKETSSAVTDLGNFLQIDAKGQVLFQLTKHEMGQGVSTALTMILAEELCADWQQVSIHIPVVDLGKFQNNEHGQYGTGGSGTIKTMTPILRKAGATARQMLVQAASNRWNVASEECTAENHFVVHKATKRKVGFGELANEASKLKVPSEAQLKSENEFQLIGKSKAAKFIPNIVTGQMRYGIDMNIPERLYALVERCPVFQGKLTSYDASAALAVQGVKKVVTTQSVAGIQGSLFPYDIREGVAVLADSFWAAQKGREALKIEWDEGPNGKRSLADLEKIAEQRGSKRVEPTGFRGEENAISNLDKVKTTLRASYVFPHQLHSLMEPLNCTAHFKGDSCEFWLGTQAPDVLIDEVAAKFNLKPENIVVHPFPSGGGFGRRFYPDMAIEAACISKEAGNIPVKMMWTREDDHRTNLVHCYQRFDFQAALDKDDQLFAWYEKEGRTYNWDRNFAPPELSWMGYDIPHVRYDYEDLIGESIIQSTAWRAVMCNGYALSECFIDEVAAHLGRDPYQYRLSLLKEGKEMNVAHLYTISNTRLMKVLKLAAEKSNWGSPLGAGRGRGIAVYPYLHGNSYCAMVVDVTVTNRKVSIDRVVCAVDCGLVINPSGVKNQIEGGVIWGLTALLHGGIDIQNGRVTTSNFLQNKVLRVHECPEIEVHFVEDPGDKPWGIGELANPVIVPAALNAISAAMGKRVRRIPVSLS